VDSRADPLTLVIACMDDQFLSPGGWRDRAWREACASHPLGRPCQARSAFQHSEMIDRFKLMLREQNLKQAGWEVASMSAAADLIVHTLRSCLPVEAVEKGSARAVDGVVEFLDSNFYKQVQLPDLAERCGLSPRRFTDLFKQRTGLTLTHYLNKRRIEYAKERLRETDQILYSCYESGFRDVAYFYRVFKRHTGMTPGSFLTSLKAPGRDVA
jgi:AraC-like DNA-binding protein